MSALSTYNQRFESLLPKFQDSARFAFRGRNDTDREEAVADVWADAWSAWHGLIRRCKDPMAVGPHGNLSNAIRYGRNGRCIGNRGRGRGRMYPWNGRAQRARGFRIVSLVSARREGELRAWVADDRGSTPADHAAFLVDFREWLSRLTERRRRSAELLSQGYGTGKVARELGVMPAAISQDRAVLARSWGQSQRDGIG
jgi:hypothetical protein